MIEQQVSTTPDATAVEWDDQAWSYRELWQRAETIRHCLARDGIPADAKIAVSGRRSPALIAAIVAVLTGGGVLLTIDPQLPRLRQHAMLTESDAACLVFVAADDTATPVSVTEG